MNYIHVKCDICCGIIGMFNRNTFSCDTCRKEFDLHCIDYDRLLINDKTGWMFPVLDKKQS